MTKILYNNYEVYKMTRTKKIKHDKKNEEIIETNNTLNKKELYDLRQAEKRKEKEKIVRKNKKATKKKSKKTYKTNLIGRIFAIIMLILMIGSVIATISYYFSSAK